MYLSAHEITHGFDNEGVKYDSHGNNKLLFDNETMEGFKNSSNCLMDQYSDYRVNGTSANVDGNLTLRENIADQGGLRIEENAYENWLRSNKDVNLPKLEKFGPSKLFYLGYAMPWCVAYSEALHEAQRQAGDTHAPRQFRVIGSLSNSKKFASAWGCKKGSKMNPIQKCSIWG